VILNKKRTSSEYYETCIYYNNRVRCCDGLFAVPQVRGQSVLRNSGDARSSSPDSSKAGTSSVDDTTLKKAARAFPRIRQINLKVQEKLKETSGTQEQREVLDQAHNQETAITRQEGIDPDQYNQ
jgi:uncharacterized protein DUF4168